MFSVFVFLFHSERAVYESKVLRVDAYLRKEESCRKGGIMKLLKVDNRKYPGFSEGAGRSRDRTSGDIKD